MIYNKELTTKEFANWLKSLPFNGPLLIRRNKDGKYVIKEPRPCKVIQDEQKKDNH